MHQDGLRLDDLRPDIEESEMDILDDDRKGDRERKNMVDELTKSISTRTVARILIPKVSTLKKSLKMANLLLLLEKVIDEVTVMIFYNSVIELVAWVVGILAFFAYPSGMFLIWLHFIHIPRGVFGLIISLKKLPNASEVLSKITEFEGQDTEEQWKFEKMMFRVRDNFKNYAIKHLKGAQKFLFIYFILSVVGSLIDSIGLFIQIILFGTSDNVYEPLFMIACVSILMSTNFSYLFYILSFSYKLSDAFRKEIFKAVVGKASPLLERIVRKKVSNSGPLNKNPNLVKNPNNRKLND